MKHTFTRIIATALCIMLLVSALSVAVSAANVYDENVDNYYSVVSKQDWDLSPGVTESEIVVNNTSGSRRQVLHVVEADINNPYASVMTSYTNIQPETYITPEKYDVSGMSKHAADIEQNFGYNVVAGMNCCLSWYNSAEYVSDPSRVNEPLGVMVVDGYTMFDHSVGFPTCLVINKDERPDGMAKVEMKTITSANQLTGYEEQVIPTSSGFILQDGVVTQSENHTDAASRSVVGIKPDGTVVILMNDGRQAPFSVGMSTYELAMAMKSLGCSYAVNCDGGGSSTFLSQRPGEELSINGTLSEGVERPNTSGIMVISSAPASGEFEVAHVTAENDIVTPGSTVQFTALGTDLSGAEVDIPEDAAWALENDSFGSIDQNGLFTSNGTTGEATVQVTVPDDAVNDRTVVFTNNKNLSSVNIYYWSDENDAMIAWPGVPMEDFGVNEFDQPRFKFDLPEGATKFIINDGSGYQTANLDFNGKIGIYLDDQYNAQGFDISNLRKVVGSATVTVTIPERLAFEMENITVPFGKSVNLNVNAYVGAKSVTLKDDDIQFSLSDNEIGTISGNTFTAPAESEVTQATVTATFTGTQISASANLTLGRGSVVLLDFEDANTGLITSRDMHGYHNVSSTYLVDRTNGQVHSGDYAWALHGDFSETCDWGGVQGINFVYNGEDLDMTGCTAIGFWMYIPEEAVGIYPALRGLVTDPTGKNVTFMPDDYTKPYSGSCVEESGWQYITVDMTGFAGDTVEIRNGNIIFQLYLQYVFNKPYDKSINTDVVFYVDDFTVDYSSAVDDREEPIFGTVNCVANDISGTTVAMPRYSTPSINAGTVSFTASVAEDTTKSNYTGLNTSSAKAYVDGVEVNCNYVGGAIYTDNMSLAAGVHTAKFSICDAMGNEAVVVRKINIDANDDLATVALVPHDTSITKALCGSLYYLDVKANEVQSISSVDMTIDLNNVNDWELQGMEVADGFTATWEMDEVEHVATLHFENTGEVNISGEYVIASLPVRVWWSEGWTYGDKTAEATGSKTWTPVNEWSTKTLWPMDIKVDVDYGMITFTDGTVGSFTGDQIVTDSEIYYSRLTSAGSTGIALFDSADWSSKTRWHQHDAHAIADVPATCTNDGYTGRTFCDDCNSVVDWGTVVPATGHTYDVQNGKLVCECGDIYPISGLEEVGGNYYYGISGSLYGGWQLIDNDWYYFDPETFTSVDVLNNGAVTYSFEPNGKLVKGEWSVTSAGIRYYYGPDYYHFVYEQFVVIDGETYCFPRSGYAYTGLCPVYDRTEDKYYWYTFDEDGKLISEYEETGIVEFGGHKYYVIDGITGYGMYKIDGDYYYAASANKNALVADKARECYVNHGLLPVAVYRFGADAKMLNNTVYDVDGKLYYFVRGKESQGDGTVSIDGSEAQIDSDGFVHYTGIFNEENYVDGIATPVAKQGLVFDKDGEIRYYVDDEPIYAGVVTDGNGNYYYINSSKKAVKNCSYTIGQTRANGLVESGTYSFDADGKMINPVIPEPVQPDQPKNGLVFEDNGDIRYYVDDEPTYAGVVTDGNGNYYYINSSKKAVKNCSYTIGQTRANGLVESGTYSFDADGKMINPVLPEPVQPDQPKNGLVFEDNGDIRYYVDDEPTYAGVVTDGNGNYYYINSSKKAVKNCSYTIGKTRANGLVESGTYEFAADGKMINPVVVN